jgi:hypothetical protein
MVTAPARQPHVPLLFPATLAMIAALAAALAAHDLAHLFDMLRGDG